jgi:hypothetical protein
MKEPKNLFEFEFTFLEALEELSKALEDKNLQAVSQSFNNVIETILHTTTQAMKKNNPNAKTFITLNDSGRAIMGILEKEPTKEKIYKN